MLPFVIIAIFTWCVAEFAPVTLTHSSTADYYELRAKELDMRRVAEAIELYRRQFGSYPASLTALAATPGYQYLGSNLNNWQSYAATGALNDGTWTFKRIAAFTRSPGSGSVASYLGKNSCGSSAFSIETGSGCGSTDSRWYVSDERRYLVDQLATQQVRMVRLNQKFADYYNRYGYYPKVDAAGTSLGASSITALAALAGYGGTAQNCEGRYQYQGIPIDCGDMFDIWGGRVGYQFEDPEHVIFVSEPPIFNGSGTRVVVAVDRA